MSPSSEPAPNPALADYRGKTIDRSDIEAKLRELQGEVEVIGEEAKSYALMAAGVIGIAIVAVAFVIGRRRGRRHRTIVEVRRY